MLNKLVMIALLMVAAPMAPSIAQDKYQTPEYSGPSARFDNGFDRYRNGRQDSRALQRRMLDQQKTQLNDLRYERNVRDRAGNAHKELIRRETELRRQTINE